MSSDKESSEITNLQGQESARNLTGKSNSPNGQVSRTRVNSTEIVKTSQLVQPNSVDEEGYTNDLQT